MKKHIEAFLNKDTTRPMRLGIAGGSGSGKSSLTNKVLTELSLDPKENSLSTDSYLVPLWEVQEALKKVFAPLNKNFREC